MRHGWRWVAALVLGLALLAAANPTEMKGHTAPRIRLRNHKGQAFDSANLNKKLVVYDFWASWCGPCLRGLPRLQEFGAWAKQQNLSVAVYTVNLKEQPEKVEQVWSRLRLALPCLMDSRGAVAAAYKIENIPVTVAVSGGKVVEVKVGESDDYLALLKSWANKYAK